MAKAKRPDGCAICGKPLKDPLSLAIGIGPKCRGGGGGGKGKKEEFVTHLGERRPERCVRKSGMCSDPIRGRQIAESIIRYLGEIELEHPEDSTQLSGVIQQLTREVQVFLPVEANPDFENIKAEVDSRNWQNPFVILAEKTCPYGLKCTQNHMPNETVYGFERLLSGLSGMLSAEDVSSLNHMANALAHSYNVDIHLRLKPAPEIPTVNWRQDAQKKLKNLGIDIGGKKRVR